MSRVSARVSANDRLREAATEHGLTFGPARGDHRGRWWQCAKQTEHTTDRRALQIVELLDAAIANPQSKEPA